MLRKFYLEKLLCNKKLFSEPEAAADYKLFPPQDLCNVSHVKFQLTFQSFVVSKYNNYLSPVVQHMHSLHGKELLLDTDSILSVWT